MYKKICVGNEFVFQKSTFEPYFTKNFKYKVFLVSKDIKLITISANKNNQTWFAGDLLDTYYWFCTKSNRHKIPNWL